MGAGSRYKLISEGPTSRGTKVVDLETDQELREIQAASFQASVDEANQLDLQIVCVAADVQTAGARVLVAHPLTGEIKRVASVTFEDGSGFAVVDGRIMGFSDEQLDVSTLASTSREFVPGRRGSRE